MNDIIEAISKLWPQLARKPDWVQWYFAVLLFLTAGFVVAMLRTEKRTTPGSEDTSVNWSPTHVSDIDTVQRSLNLLKSDDEVQILANLRALLQNHPVYNHIEEETPANAFYRFCRSSKIVGFYVPSMKTRPSARQNLVNIQQTLIKLGDRMASIWGPQFDAKEYCEKWGDKDLETFRNNLPSQTGNMLEPLDYKGKSMPRRDMLNDILADLRKQVQGL